MQIHVQNIFGVYLSRNHKSLLIKTCLLHFICCTSLSWTSPEIPKLNNTLDSPFYENLSTEEGSWLGSLVTLGAVFGPFIFSFLADTIGRKNTLLCLSLPFAFSFFLMAYAKVLWIFYVARTISGLAVGGVFMILPMYISEIALDHHRGVLGLLMSSFIASGILFDYCVGPYMSVKAFNILLGCFPLIYFVLFWIIGTETPHYLVSKGDLNRAKDVLHKLRSGSPEDVEKELANIKDIIDNEEKGSIMLIFKSKPLLKAQIICSGLLILQQFVGINAVLFYAQPIFDDANTSLSSEVCSILIGCVELAGVLLASSVANVFGRKTLLLISSAIMAVSLAILGIYEVFTEHDIADVSSFKLVPIITLLVFVLGFNIGFGPVAWTVLGEMFPTSVRAMATALNTSECYVAAFLITKYFGPLSESLGRGECFLGFAVFCAIAFLFTSIFVIETKGKSLKQIQDDLN